MSYGVGVALSRGYISLLHASVTKAVRPRKGRGHCKPGANEGEHCREPDGYTKRETADLSSFHFFLRLKALSGNQNKKPQEGTASSLRRRGLCRVAPPWGPSTSARFSLTVITKAFFACQSISLNSFGYITVSKIGVFETPRASGGPTRT